MVAGTGHIACRSSSIASVAFSTLGINVRMSILDRLSVDLIDEVYSSSPDLLLQAYHESRSFLTSQISSPGLNPNIPGPGPAILTILITYVASTAMTTHTYFIGSWSFG